MELSLKFWGQNPDSQFDDYSHLKKDSQMSETMSNNRNLPNPHLFEPLFCLAHNTNLAYEMVFHHTKHEKIPYAQYPKLAMVSALNWTARCMMAESDIGSSFIPSLYKPSSLLPIARHRDTLLYVIETFSITIIIGQTGSGKTTQIPQFLDQAGWCAEGKIIAITQVG